MYGRALFGHSHTSATIGSQSHAARLGSAEARLGSYHTAAAAAGASRGGRRVPGKPPTAEPRSEYPGELHGSAELINKLVKPVFTLLD